MMTGVEAGLAEGERRGFEKGKSLGQKEKQIEIVRKMLELKIPIEQIKEILGLTEDEIKKL